VELCREVVSPNEASPSSFFPGAAAAAAASQQANLHSLGQMGQLVSASNRVGLSIHDMALEPPGGSQYEVEPKKATKLEIKQNMGFAGASSSSSSAAAAAAAAANEGTAETAFANPSEQHGGHGHSGNAAASNWHQAHHHAQAYTSSQYPTGFFGQVTVTSSVT